MTIISAEYANEEKTCVTLQTVESGAVCIQVPPLPDVSGGWQEAFSAWRNAGGSASDYVEPIILETVEEFVTRNGYTVFSLLDLADIEREIASLDIEMPPKAAAVRAWINQSRIDLATGQPAQPAPHTYAEVTAEVLALLSQHQ